MSREEVLKRLKDMEKYTEEYIEELGKVLRTFDVEKLREFVDKRSDIITKPGRSFYENDAYMKGAMAKMIVARTDMPKELKEEAMMVLDVLGWDYDLGETE